MWQRVQSYVSRRVYGHLDPCDCDMRCLQIPVLLILNSKHMLSLLRLCYVGMPDYEAHEGSYDHQHRKRLKEMRSMTKDPNAVAKARAAEQKANEEAGMKSINISLGSSTSSASSGKKKPVFKSTLQPHNAALLGQAGEAKSVSLDAASLDADNDPSGAVRNGWFEERYQPRFVTGCDEEGCKVCANGFIDLGPRDEDEVMSNA